MIWQINITGIGMTSIRLIPDGRFWWCEGVEWDYGVQGNDISDAMWNFKIGFQRTIELNIEKFGKMDWSK